MSVCVCVCVCVHACVMEEIMSMSIALPAPQIEKELRSVLQEWENDHERHFVVKDSRYLDTINRQWEEKNATKEVEKMKRVS